MGEKIPRHAQYPKKVLGVGVGTGPPLGIGGFAAEPSPSPPAVGESKGRIVTLGGKFIWLEEQVCVGAFPKT